MKSNSIRLIELNFSTIIDKLISEKKYEECLNLLLSVNKEDHQEFVKLSLKSLAELEPISLKCIKYTKDA